MKKYYKELIKNRRAWHDYTFQQTYTAGLVLAGSEVKSIRLGRANFKDAFCRVDNGEFWLYNMHVSEYQSTRISEHQSPDRKRKLLLKKGEIKKIIGRINERGMVAIPLKLFLDGNWVKVEIGIGKSKRLYEKREMLKKKNIKRDIDRALRERNK
ncbi:SsrA-binding protein SmpB [Candidatus Margulisiibacteriota bacterium]